MSDVIIIITIIVFLIIIVIAWAVEIMYLALHSFDAFTNNVISLFLMFSPISHYQTDDSRYNICVTIKKILQKPHSHGPWPVIPQSFMTFGSQ